MKILYIYPHPDDESFGTAHVMSKQRREGHDVHLLTLTRGGATKQRFKLGYSIEEMGEVRYQEMQKVAQILGLSGMNVLDLPDSGLKEMDPRDIERVVADEIQRLRPEVLVTYPVHGISGFHDHLVTHAVVKRVYTELRDSIRNLKRLAFHTLTKEEAERNQRFNLHSSTPEEIDCIVEVAPEDVQAAHRALDCYQTYAEIIAQSGIKEQISERVAFEIYQQNHQPPLSDLFASLRCYGQ